MKIDDKIPVISLSHLKGLTTRIGIIQSSKSNVPDIESGYTLDDNARALISLTMHYELTRERGDKLMIDTYLNFIRYCQLPDGRFFNYVDKTGTYHIKNGCNNLQDSEGRAIWALGVFISKGCLFQEYYINIAELVLVKFLLHVEKLDSSRAVAYTIKGLYHYNLIRKSQEIKKLIIVLGDNLAGKYRASQNINWSWFENSITYANSVIPEAMLYAYLSSGKESFRLIAKSSFDFLLSLLFVGNKIMAVPTDALSKNGMLKNTFGQQPTDVAYMILALDIFHEVFSDNQYSEKLECAFNYFYKFNDLSKIVFNPSTDEHMDGIEKDNMNLYHEAESVVCYLMAKCLLENHIQRKNVH